MAAAIPTSTSRGLSTAVCFRAPNAGFHDGSRGHRRRHARFAGSKFTANYQTVDGPWAARQAVREQIHYGADWIKFHSTAGYEIEPDGKLFSDPTFTKEEVEAIVDEAHRHAKKAACHAFGGEGLRSCIEAGVDTIEHAIEMDEATADAIKKKGIYLELTAYHYSLSEYTEKDAKSTGGKYSLEAMREKSGRLAIARGLKISFGSGVGPFPHGSQAQEFAYPREVRHDPRAGDPIGNHGSVRNDGLAGSYRIDRKRKVCRHRRGNRAIR